MKSLKTLVIAVLAISLVLGIAIPAFASSRALPSPQPASLLKPDNGEGAVAKRPAYSQHTGNVTAFTYTEATGGNITIQAKSGTIVTFEIIAGKFKVLPKGAEVKIGAWVTVIGQRQPAQNRLIASGVVVHPPRRAPLKQITGTITAITESDNSTGTITVGTTVLKYDANTLFALRGVGIRVKVGQPATVSYREQSDGTLLAKKVLVGIKAPTPKPLPKPRTNTLAQAQPKARLNISVRAQPST